MNIIEAFQAAENGKIITNNFLKISNNYLIYHSKGNFKRYEYNERDNSSIYTGNVSHFNMAEIISTGWQIVEKDWNIFKNKKINDKDKK